MTRLVFLLFFIMIGSNVAFADILYRHVPFSVTIQREDQLIANYDFSGKNGIACQANNNSVAVTFYYKGHLKTDFLPLYLQSGHVPDNESEVLADEKGQFTLSIDQNQTKANETNVHCDFIQVK